MEIEGRWFVLFVYRKKHNGDKRKNLLPEDFSSEMKWVFMLHLFLFTIIMIIGTGVWALLRYYGSKWLCQTQAQCCAAVGLEERPKAISSGNTVRKDPHVVLSLKTSSDLFCVNIGISVWEKLWMFLLRMALQPTYQHRLCWIIDILCYVCVKRVSFEISLMQAKLNKPTVTFNSRLSPLGIKRIDKHVKLICLDCICKWQIY